MSDAAIDLSSPALSSSDPPPNQSIQRYRLSLVPISSTFPHEFLLGKDVKGRSKVPPTPRLAENNPLETEPSYEQPWQLSPNLVLGRSLTTKITSDKLNRELLDVRLIRRPLQGPADTMIVPSIVVQLLKPKKCVRINGSLLDIEVNETREVQAGDVLTLCHDEFGSPLFGYTVQLEEYQPDVVDLLSSDDE
jgi:hypothetical protein